MAIALRTPVCELLGIQVPILSVGFGTGARAELAAAVSNAGGFGVLGASGMQPDTLRAEIARTRTLTAQRFGINVIIAEDPDDDRQFFLSQIRAAAAEGVAAVVFFWGDPAPYVDDARSGGVKVLIQVGSVDEAKRAAGAGVDALIAQGIEAGGTFAARPGSGSSSRRWSKRSRRFRCSRPGGSATERASRGHSSSEPKASRSGPTSSRATRRTCIPTTSAGSSRAAATTPCTPRSSTTCGGRMRRIAPRNRTYEVWAAAGRPPTGERPDEGTSIGTRRVSSRAVVEWPRYAVGMATPDFSGDVEDAPLWAGESCGVVNDIKPAGDIVRELARDAAAALAATA